MKKDLERFLLKRARENCPPGYAVVRVVPRSKIEKGLEKEALKTQKQKDRVREFRKVSISIVTNSLLTY